MRVRTTPIATNKTQALTRVITAVTHGYTRLCTGVVRPEKIIPLAIKFDIQYGIAHTKGQRVQRQRAGVANTMFAAYRRPEEYRRQNECLPWMLLATSGKGVEEERWIEVAEHPVWLGYELYRHNDLGGVRWSWRRTKREMTELYAELGDYLARRRSDEVQKLLKRVADQPGFHGVRTQSQMLCSYAVARGYEGALPTLFYVQKMTHGEVTALSHETAP